MFHPGGDDRKKTNARVLAEMIALLGPPPEDFLRRADETLAYWSHKGTCVLRTLLILLALLTGLVFIRSLERVRGDSQSLSRGYRNISRRRQQ